MKKMFAAAVICGLLLVSHAAELQNPPAPFAAQGAVKGTPELLETQLMKHGSGGTAKVADKQFSFVCGDKTLYAKPGDAALSLNTAGAPLLNISCWGSTKAGYGHPFNSSAPELKCDQAGRAVEITRKFDAAAKDDSLFTAKAKLLDNGLIDLDFSCQMPEGRKPDDFCVFMRFAKTGAFEASLGKSKDFVPRTAAMKFKLGDKEFAFAGANAPLEDKTLFSGAFSGWLTFFSDKPAQSVAFEIPAGCALTIRELRKDPNPDKRSIEIRIQPKQPGALKLKADIRNSSPEALKTGDSFAGINFWKSDRLHIPNFSACRNLLQNPSFEAGLHYYATGVLIWGSWQDADRKIYSVDGSVSKFGKRSLRATCFKDYNDPSSLSSFTIPTIPGKSYTFSFYAKGDAPGQAIDVACVSGEWMKFPKMPNFDVGKDWSRYSATFTAPNAAAIIVFRPKSSGQANESHIWMDGLQLEEGESATEYVEQPASVALLTNDEGSFFASGNAIDAKVRIHAASGAKGVLSCEVEDFFYAKPYAGSFEFTTDESGDATVKLPLDGLLGKGAYVVRTDVKLGTGEANTDFHRIFIADKAPACSARSIFAAMFVMPCNAEAMFARLQYLGFGSSNYQTNSKTSKLAERYGMPNVGASGVIDYGPQGPGRDALHKRIKEEPYSESLRAETERVAYDVAKANPWVKTWFLQAESSRSKIGCLKSNDNEGFAKLIAACRAGVLKADPSLKFMFEGGPTNMYPDNGTDLYSKWLDGAAKATPGIRYDAFAIHPYRPTPENPDLDADADVYLKMLERHGYKTEPVYWNEGIYNCPWEVPEWGLDVHKGCSTDHWRAGKPSYHMGWAERISAAYYARSYLVALKYADRVKQFNGWASYTFFDSSLAPFAWMKIPNTLCRIIGDAKFKKDIRFAPNCRAYVFEDAQGRPVAALWSHIPDVDRGLERSPVAKLGFNGSTLEFIDLMENSLAAAKSADGALEVPVTPFPLFIRGKAGETDALCESIANASLSGAKEFPLAVDLKLKSRSAAELFFANRISRKFEGVAKAGSREFKLSIPESGFASAQVALPAPLPFDRFAPVSLPLTISENGGDSVSKDFSMRAMAVSNTPAWDSVPWVKLTNRNVYKSAGGGTSAAPIEVKAGYEGDFEAEFKLRWDSQKLHLIVKVKDDKPFFPSGENNGDDWKLDSLQIYLDTYGDNASRKTKSIFDFNDYAYIVSRDAKTGHARVWRQAAPEQQVAGGLDAPMPSKVATEAEAKVTMTPDGYIYEVALPARIIAPLKLQSGSFARLGLTVSDNDGERRKGCIVNTETPDSEPFSAPEQWPGIILAEEIR